ncbi:MAG: hypothetical protein GXY38_10455 [Planctomycetes bacterium]|nr:hypothetical protein [Planctomycetota bacterium]
MLLEITANISPQIQYNLQMSAVLHFDGGLAASSTAEYMVYGGLLIAVVIFLGAGLLWIRRMFLSSNKPQASNGIDIESIEKLKRDGIITEDEFSRLRRLTLGLDKSPAGNDNSSLSTDGNRVDDENMADDGPEPPAGRSDA